MSIAQPYQPLHHIRPHTLPHSYSLLILTRIHIPIRILINILTAMCIIRHLHLRLHQVTIIIRHPLTHRPDRAFSDITWGQLQSVHLLLFPQPLRLPVALPFPLIHTPTPTRIRTHSVLSSTPRCSSHQRTTILMVLLTRFRRAPFSVQVSPDDDKLDSIRVFIIFNNNSFQLRLTVTFRIKNSFKFFTTHTTQDSRNCANVFVTFVLDCAQIFGNN